jgi:co-chaperonin GroES (HSP10)
VYNDEQVSYISAASVLDVLAVWDEEEKKLIPLGSNIEIKTVPPPDQMGGIYIPDTQRPISGVAEVVTVGRGWRGVNGKPIEFQVEAGQRVAFRSLEVMIVDLRPLGIDEDREIIMHGAVLAVLEDADAKEQAK